jgi:hypothetical protein
VAAGETLPSSWRDGAPTGEEPGPRAAAAQIEELTSALESAASDAVARLRDVMAATSEDTSSEPEEADEDAAGDSGDDATTAQAASEPAAEGSPASS